MPRISDAAGRGRRIATVGGIDLVVTAGGALMSFAVAAAVLPDGPITAVADPASALLVVPLTLVVGLSVVAHELGHALVARHDGIGVDRVTLSFIGGTTEIVEPIDRPSTEVRVALAGPAASIAAAIALGSVAWAIDDGWSGWSRSFALLAAWNLLVALVNVLPVRPLDGGHVVSAWRRRGGVDHQPEARR